MFSILWHIFTAYLALNAGLYCYQKLQYNPQKQRIFALCVAVSALAWVIVVFPGANAGDVRIHRYLRRELYTHNQVVIPAIPTKKNLRYVRELPFIKPRNMMTRSINGSYISPHISVVL